MKKACIAALSLLVHIRPSGPCAAWNVLVAIRNRLSDREELGMREDSLLETGERGGGLGVAGLCPAQGRGMGCQEIGLVTFMFFFELLFSYVSSQFPSMFPLLTYSQSFLSLSADYLRHSRRRRSQISILLIQEKSRNHFTT